MYNMIFGVNVNANDVLEALGLTYDNVPRFRDAYVSDDGLFCIHTRTGGGNRDFYENLETCKGHFPEYFKDTESPEGPWNDDLRAHSWFVRDEDDDFDCTYATFYFQPPKEVVASIDAIPSLAPSEKWQLLLKESGEKSK